MFAADSCPQLSYLTVAEVPAGRMGLEPVLESGRIRRTVQTRGKYISPVRAGQMLLNASMAAVDHCGSIAWRPRLSAFLNEVARCVIIEPTSKELRYCPQDHSGILKS
jgi:hypothetical protein